jgi:phosphoribosylformimino-5-aminoimidazole carboxamide ribotide isomerase
MLVIPAIDLWDKKVVRFTKGEKASCKVYNTDPVEVAKRWEEEGAQFLHLVDLSSALGEKDNLDIIRDILGAVKIKVEVGGGIRNIKKAEKIISYGAERVIIGTKAKDEKFLKEIIKTLGEEKVAVSLDVRNLCISLGGWKETTDINVFDFLNYLKDKGIKWIIYTDILRDGTLSGPNLDEAKKVCKPGKINFILSGGISSVEDLKMVKKEIPHLWGVILGKALYEGKLNFSCAIEALKK